MGWLQQKRINLLERSLAVMQRAARRSSRSESQPAHLATGIDGEDAAFFYLGRKGYTVVARRWSSGYQRGDLDLIAWHGPLLCFVEVKTRSAHDMAAAEVTVDADNGCRALRRAWPVPFCNEMVAPPVSIQKSFASSKVK